LNRIEHIKVESSEVYIIDYSDCKEAEMIVLVSQLKEKILTGNKKVLILSIINDRCYVTSKFMRHAEKETGEVLHLIEKQATVGLNETKKMILKGYNFLFRKNIKAFDTRDAAFDFLIDEKTTDKATFWD
jgi:hypothetical protein